MNACSPKGLSDPLGIARDTLSATGELTRIRENLKKKLGGTTWECILTSECEKLTEGAEKESQLAKLLEQLSPIARESFPVDVHKWLLKELTQLIHSRSELLSKIEYENPERRPVN